MEPKYSKVGSLSGRLHSVALMQQVKKHGEAHEKETEFSVLFSADDQSTSDIGVHSQPTTESTIESPVNSSYRPPFHSSSPSSPPPSFHSSQEPFEQPSEVQDNLVGAFDDSDGLSDDDYADDRIIHPGRATDEDGRYQQIDTVVSSSSSPSSSSSSASSSSSSSSSSSNRPSIFNHGILSYLRLHKNPTTNNNGSTVSSANNNDGVFANLTAKPETDKVNEENPPSYEEAAADATPPYWETTIMAPGLTDEILIDGLPVGSPINFIWNMMVSSAFQFVGFLLTYLLHTSHAAKHGSRAGLGFTLFQYGFYLQPSSTIPPPPADGTFEPNNPNDFDINSYTYTVSGNFEQGQVSSHSTTTTIDSIEDAGASNWISIALMVFGGFWILKSVVDYIRVRRMELAVLRSPAATPVQEVVFEN